MGDAEEPRDGAGADPPQGKDPVRRDGPRGRTLEVVVLVDFDKR